MHTEPDPTIAGTEGMALLGVLEHVSPGAPTACSGWTVHDLTAHLAAGAMEIADLVERHLAGDPDRPTRAFAEREAPMRALAPDVLRERLVVESLRKIAAYEQLATAVDPTIAFTGARLHVDQLTMHSRSEAAIHRWDLVGDDPVSCALLAQPELTRHAVTVLNAMPVLQESARAIGERFGRQACVALRALDQPTVVFGPTGLALNDQDTDVDAAITAGAADRLLLLWGRSPSDLSVDGDREVSAALLAALAPGT